MDYGDGIVSFYSLPAAGNGNMPGTAGTLICSQYYGNKTVGFNRYYTAKANNDNIDKLIECWAVPNIDTADYAVIDTVKYDILQVQYSENDDGLDIMTISLGRRNA